MTTVAALFVYLAPQMPDMMGALRGDWTDAAPFGGAAALLGLSGALLGLSG